ncbi:MAG: carboxypeptidase M32 [Anaerolineales bacterium]|nr:MAG: carboxypeptidase M32 [Anaerolineales bacterium]
MEAKLQELKARLGEIHDLNKAVALLGWDQQTYMPRGGAPARAEQLATLQKTAHNWFIADEIGALIETLDGSESEWDYDSDEASLVRVIARDYAKARKIPGELVAEFARVTTLAYEAWTKARRQSDFSIFQPHLEKIVELNVRLAETLGYEDRIYDPLLDQFEPEMKTSQVEAIFDDLKAELLPLVRTISKQTDAVDDSVLRRPYDGEKQWSFGLEVIKDFGFDLTRGRQDESVHPFTTSFSISDVRLTTRVDPNYLPTALFGTLHECGHGLYEQGINLGLERTFLDDGVSLGIHESQSRLWENLVGRSREFWSCYFSRLQTFFPHQLAEVDAESFYRAINRVEPSFIRVEADEVTYNLHIMLRFELENEMLEGKLRIADLPEAWNAKMETYLGIVPPDHAKGVLQDVHWSNGMLGYFPTYALGNLISVQLFDRIQADIPSLRDQIATGTFDELLSWLRENVHHHGRKYIPDELVRRVTGNSLTATNYIAYIRAKYSEIYEL